MSTRKPGATTTIHISVVDAEVAARIDALAELLSEPLPMAKRWLGENLYRLRAAAGWSQEKAAEHAELHVRFYQRCDIGHLARHGSGGLLFRPGILPDKKKKAHGMHAHEPFRAVALGR